MAGSENRTEVREIDLTPNLPNSPVVDQLMRFIERVYSYDENMESGSALHTYLQANKRFVVEAARQVKTDDSLILITGKLPSDRDRYIGTKRLIPA